MSLPTGTLTFLFSDIEGSSQLWERHSAAMRPAVIRHNDLLRDAVEGHGGYVVKFRGDGVFAVFADARKAVLAALTAQEAILAEPWDENVGQLKVRMGLHTGPADLQEDDYYGPTVNRAARLEEAGHGGQILLTQVTQGMIRDTLPAEVELLDLGEHLIRDFPQPEHVYQLVSPPLNRDFPPLRSLRSHRSNLPASPTPFIGREEELASLDELLANPETRLVTIIGPGGMGKTRLALASAERQLVSGRFPDGVLFIPLAPLGEADLIPTTMAEVFDLTLEGGREHGQGPRRQVLDYLSQKQILLVMDNFEHLLDGADLVAEIVQTAPRIRILATSRERLNLMVEQLYPLQGLDFPERETPDGAADYSAVRLFGERARRVAPGFVLGANDLIDMSRICRLVAGMPLAIELAAAWVDTLSLAEIAAELQGDLNILVTDARDVPERQQSVRIVFDSAWKRMSPAEREILAQLSVFRGGFTREAGQAVSGVTLQQLNSLTKKALLQLNQAAGRYELHELLRQFSLEKLRVHGGAEQSARERHSQFFAAFMRDREAELDTMRDIEALAAIESEIDNLRAGWEWAAAKRQAGTIEQYLKSLEVFYEIRGSYLEAINVFSRAKSFIEKLGMDRGANLLLGAILAGLGQMYAHTYQAETAKSLLEESLAIARRSGSPALLADVYGKVGTAAMFRGENAQAKRYFLNALSTIEPDGSDSATAAAYADLGWVTSRLVGETEEAARYLHKALTLLRDGGPRRHLVWVLNDLGRIEHRLGRYQNARRYMLEGVAICREVGYQYALSSCLIDLGAVARDMGAYEEANGQLEASLPILQALGIMAEQIQPFSLLAYVAILQDNMPQAKGYLQEARRIDPSGWGDTYLGFLYLSQGEFALAHERYQQAGAHFRKSLALSEDENHMAGVIWSLKGLARVDHARKSYEEAMGTFAKALKKAQDASIVPEILDALLGIASVQARRSKWVRAAELAAAALDHPGSKQVTKNEAAMLLNELESEMSPEALASAVARGRKLSLDQSVELAMRNGDPPN